MAVCVFFCLPMQKIDLFVFVCMFVCGAVRHSFVCFIPLLQVTLSSLLVEAMKDITQHWIHHNRVVQQSVSQSGFWNSVACLSSLCVSTEPVTQLMRQVPFNCVCVLCSWPDLLMSWLGIKAHLMQGAQLFCWRACLFSDPSWSDNGFSL